MADTTVKDDAQEVTQLTAQGANINTKTKRGTGLVAWVFSDDKARNVSYEGIIALFYEAKEQFHMLVKAESDVNKRGFS